ncbi:hypothetical protein LY78DRAFT_666473 [Colletotrichum sublineola]|nr:hypothetical protein LY78DRAFT_666473 [Colletotrichum sublineola]
MRSVYPLLVVLGSLSCTFASPVPPQAPDPVPAPATSASAAPPNPTGPVADHLDKKPLRDDKDTYTVAVKGDKYLVFSPYYRDGKAPVTELLFPSDKKDEIVVTKALNVKEKKHTDGSKRLPLSDIMEAVASDKHAKRPLSTINTVVVRNIRGKRTEKAIHKSYEDWKKQQSDSKKAKMPEKLAVQSSDPAWKEFKNTPFFKTVNKAFEHSKKAVVSVEIFAKEGKKGHKHGRDLAFKMGPAKS